MFCVFWFIFCCLFVGWFVLVSFSFQFVEGAGSLPWPGGSATKPGKPKGKKKISSVRQKFDVSARGSLYICQILKTSDLLLIQAVR